MSRFSLGFLATHFITSLFLWAPATYPAELLRDINVTTAGAVAMRITPVDLESVTLFIFDDGVSGAELWRTDGTPDGTSQVRDINPGPAPSEIHSLMVAQGRAYFWANDGTNGSELWKSDGTAGGTRIVANVRPQEGLDGPIGPPLAAMGSVVYFAQNDGATGVELWRSDGSNDGTYRVKDIAPGAASSEPEDLITVGSKVFFSANDQVSGRELWVTDGTPEGTHLVRDIHSGVGDSGPRRMLPVDGRLYFVANTDAGRSDVWRVDPGNDGVSMIEDHTDSRIVSALIQAGEGVVYARDETLYGAGATAEATALADLPCPYAEPAAVIVLSQRTLFNMKHKCSLNGQEAFTEIWTTDGTPSGTGPLNPDESLAFQFGAAVFAIAANGEAYMGAYKCLPGCISRASETNIWRSDGTRAGTRQVTDFEHSASALNMARLGGRVYFDYGRHVTPAGDEIWSTDGTTQGTRLLLDINEGSDSSNVDQLSVARGKLLFIADDGVTGREPWISDGTPSGTQRLHQQPVVQNTAGSSPNNYFPVAGGALFVADDGISGSELWFTDGTAAGTRQLADIAPGPMSSLPSHFVALPGQVLFSADDGTSGRELWRTDGTAAGTWRVADILPGPSSSDPIGSGFGAGVLNGVAYFAIADGMNSRQLWRSDGTTIGTYQIMTMSPGSPLWVMDSLDTPGFFVALVGTTLRLWVTDGTTAGTAPLSTDVEVTDAFGSVIFQGFLYFRGIDADGDRELWRSDGTPAGTVRVRDLNTNGSSDPTGFVVNSSVLLFCTLSTAGACTLYGSRDPAAAIESLGDFQLSGQPFVTDGTRFAFTDTSTSSAGRLVLTDGTGAGTTYLEGDLPFSGDIMQYAWFNGAVVMSVRDQVLGPSLWITRGTAQTTHLLADIDPTTLGDWPGDFHALGTKLLFMAYHPAFDLEPWMIDAALPSAGDEAVRTAADMPVTIPVLANDGDFGGPLDTGSIEIVTPPERGDVAVDASTGQMVYTPHAGQGGQDVLQYTVRNAQGGISNVANVFVAVANGAGPQPGSAPQPPPAPPPPPSDSSVGGGGGGIDLAMLLCLLSLLLGRSGATRKVAFVARAWKRS